MARRHERRLLQRGSYAEITFFPPKWLEKRLPQVCTPILYPVTGLEWASRCPPAGASSHPLSLRLATGASRFAARTPASNGPDQKASHPRRNSPGRQAIVFPRVERVVVQRGSYQVVEKYGDSGQATPELDPRRRA